MPYAMQSQGPLISQMPLADQRRYQLAQELMKQGSDTSPIQHPLQGWARLAQALSGHYQAKDVETKSEAEQKATDEAMRVGLAKMLGDHGRPPALDPQEIAQSADYGTPLPPNVGAVPGQGMAGLIAALTGEKGTKETRRTALGLQIGQSEKAEDRKFTAEQQQRGFKHAEAQQTGQQNFTGRQNDLNRSIEGLKIEATAGKNIFDKANTLRDEFNTLTKDFRTVQDAHSKIKKSTDTGAGDMALLYSFVKLLDPGSVVRESEFATAAASGSFGERIQGAAQRVISGQRLAPSLRAEFLTEADKIYDGQKQGYDTTAVNYIALAKRAGIPTADVIQDYAVTGAGAPSVAPSATGASGTPVSGIPTFRSPQDPDFVKLPKGSAFYDDKGAMRFKQ